MTAEPWTQPLLWDGDPDDLDWFLADDWPELDRIDLNSLAPAELDAELARRGPEPTPPWDFGPSAANPRRDRPLWRRDTETLHVIGEVL